RRRIGGFSPLGRETAIDRVDWLDDGWPVLNRGAGPSDHAPADVHSTRAFGFEEPELDLSWCFIRRPPADGICLASRPGHLRLRGGASGLDSRTGVCAVLRREVSHRYEATTRVEFSPRPGEEAGLVCYYDTDNHVQLALAEDCGTRLRLSKRARGEFSVVADVPLNTQGPLWLRLEVNGLNRVFSFSHDGVSWHRVAALGDCGFMSDEGTSRWGFTGTMVGFYARRAPDQLPLQADFAMLLLSENPPGPKAS
ncbi:MAG: beta,4-xylosidase XynB, partial [Verrucomicrobiota bacterium]